MLGEAGGSGRLIEALAQYYNEWGEMQTEKRGKLRARRICRGRCSQSTR